MSEPRAVADAVVEVVPDIFHWRVEDERIGGFVSAAHAWRSDRGTILVDPLPLAEVLLARLEPVTAILLTAGTHQRSAWRYRRELGAPVWAPALSKQVEEEPDERYGDGDLLPGGLRAVFTPGAGTTQHTLMLEEAAVAFVADLLVRPPGRDVALISAEYAYDVDEARRSLGSLLELDFDVLCLAHGEPVVSDAKDAVRAALAR